MAIMKPPYTVKRKIVNSQIIWDVIDRGRGRGMVSIICSCADKMDAEQIASVMSEYEVAGRMHVACIEECNRNDMNRKDIKLNISKVKPL